MKIICLHHISQTGVSRFLTVSCFLYTLALSHVYFFVYLPFPGHAVAVTMSHPRLEFLETVLTPQWWRDFLWNCFVTVFLCELLKPLIGVYSRRLLQTTVRICGSFVLWNIVFLIWLVWWKMLLEMFMCIKSISFGGKKRPSCLDFP